MEHYMNKPDRCRISCYDVYMDYKNKMPYKKIAKKHEISVDEVKRIIKQANRITSLKSPLDELWLDEADFQ